MFLNQAAWALIGVVLAAWTVAAGWAVLSARARQRRADASARLARRLGRMIDDAPALPMVVRADGRIEGPARLATWFGFDAMPGYLSELDAGADGGDGPQRAVGLDEYQLSQLSDAVRRTQKTAAPFALTLALAGTGKALAVRGHLADPQISPGGAALVWFFDFTQSEEELRRLRAETAAARATSRGVAPSTGSTSSVPKFTTSGPLRPPTART